MECEREQGRESAVDAQDSRRGSKVEGAARISLMCFCCRCVCCVRLQNALIGLSFGHHDQAHAFLVKVREHIPLHGSAAKAPAKKAGLLQRLFGSVAGGSGSGDRDSGAPGTISTPSSVVHTAHAGFDPVSGSFDQRDLPAEWRWLFEARGFHSHVHANANANANANASVDAGAANATNGSGSAS